MPERQLELLSVSQLTQQPAPINVHDAPAKAHKLLTNGHLGADLLVVEPDSRFPLHTHPGDHLLLVITGTGGVFYGGEDVATRPGDLCLVPGGVPHSVYAGKRGQIIMAIGAPHTPVDSHERMAIVDGV
jgi:quercetin dioxygenase-like cupin family protein